MKRIRVAVIGCGSVSGVYLPHLSKCPHVELVSACDTIPERAKDRAEKFKIPNQYPHIDKLLAGAPFAHCRSPDRRHRASIRPRR